MDLLSEFSQLMRFLKEQVRRLATIVSRALQPRDGRIPCPVDRNLDFFFNFPNLFFVRFLDKVEMTVNKICF